MNQLNWKQIAIHTIVIWLLCFSVQTFAFLTDLQLAELIRNGSNLSDLISEKIFSVSSFVSLDLSCAIGRTIGIVSGLILSLITCRINQLKVKNSVIAFLLILALNLVDFLGWNSLQFIFLLPGTMLSGLWFYVVNGAFMFIIASVLLFSKTVNTWIKGKVVQNHHYA